MNKPKFTYCVLEEIDGQYEFIPEKTHDAEGSYSPSETMYKKIRIWNNKAGDEDILDANDAQLIIMFKNYEDNFMLKLCKIKEGDNPAEDISIDIDRGYYKLGNISGRSNNGSDMNKDNYKEIELQVGPIPNNIRSELKSLILDIEYD